MDASKLTDTLNSALVGLINAATSATNFLIDQIPDVPYQLLLWKAVESAVCTVIGIAIIGFMLYQYQKLYRKQLASAKVYHDGTKDTENIHLIFALAGLPLGIITGLLAEKFLSLTWLQIWLAPKIYLLEYAAKLIK